MNTLLLPVRFFQSLSWSGRLGLLMSLFWLLMAAFGTQLAPHNIDDIGGGPLMGGLTPDNLLGTDYLGRDMLSRILYGAKFSIGLALSAALLASLIGTLLALLAAVAGRWLEELLGRVNDALLVLPGKVLSLMIVAVFGSDADSDCGLHLLAGRIPHRFRHGQHAAQHGLRPRLATAR